jgi:hypothetical protein
VSSVCLIFNRTCSWNSDSVNVHAYWVRVSQVCELYESFDSVGFTETRQLAHQSSIQHPLDFGCDGKPTGLTRLCRVKQCNRETVQV